MKRFRAAAGLTSLLWTALLAAPAQANFHFWEIEEIYTNYDGSVQFIELATSFNSQHVVNGHEIRVIVNGIATNTFIFNSNLPNSSTQDKTVLIATPGFGDLAGGVEPDYFLPDPMSSGPFFDPYVASMTISFVGADSVTFAGSLLPTDGDNSLYFTTSGLTSTGSNSPQNFAGDDGGVTLPPPATDGDYNGDGVVDTADYVTWRKTDGSQGGYDTWRMHFGESLSGAGSGANNTPAVPEPATVTLLALLAAYVSAVIRRPKAG
jgi:hypothetical protein